MKYLKTYEARISSRYNKGDFLLVNYGIRLEERDFYALRGLDIEGINSNIKGIEPYEDWDPSIVEVKKIEWYDSETKKYLTEYLFSGLELSVDESDIIEKLTDDRLLEEMNKMEKKISEWIELFHAKKEGEKYNL